MLYRIFGKSGHGKTKYIFDRLSDCIKHEKKAFLVVPEQIAVETEKKLLKLLGARSNMYIEVINFKRLCNRVFRELGGLTDAHLDDGAKKILMMRNLENLYPYLKEYGKSCENAEFAEKALAALSELSQFKISPKQLEEAAEQLAQNQATSDTAGKLYDIALIAEGYDERLSKIDGAVGDIYQKLCDKLEQAFFFENTEVFFDSFYGFTEREYQIISLVAEQADNTYITFSYDKGNTDAVFERSRTAAKKCKKIAEKCGCELQDIILDKNVRHKENSGLYKFAEGFCAYSLSENNSDIVSDGSIQTCLCKDIFDEAKFAASTVKRLVRQGARYSDIAICAANLSDYVGIIDTTFLKADIPLGIDIPETLAESAVFELVISSLEAAKTFKNDAVIRYIKTGLSGLSGEEEDLFETYVRTWDIPPKLMKKDEDFTMNPDGYVDSDVDMQVLSVVNSARMKVHTCLTSLSVNLKSAQTVKDYAMCVYNLLQDIKRVSGKDVFYDGNGNRSLELLYTALDSFVGAAGDEKMPLSTFVTLFKSCGKNYDTGHIPALSNQVQLSSAALARTDGKKYVIVLGVNSGVFPSSCKTNSLLSDEEKRLLRQNGIKLSEDERERVYDELFLAYSIISGASDGCFVSYLALDNSGSAMFPSVIVTAVNNLAGKYNIVYSPDDFNENYAGDELLFEQMILLEDGVKKHTLERYFENIPVYKDRLNAYKNGFEQKDYLDGETSHLLYGENVITSYSRLEKMAGCPFSHFCTYTLRLRPEPVASLGPSEAGSVMHKILEELVPALCTENDKGEYPSERDAREMVSRLLSEHLSRIAKTDINNLSKRFVYLYTRLARILCDISTHISGELRVTKFKPCEFEMNIASDGDVKPVPIDLGDGKTLYIVGQIDRVDVYNKDGVNYVRIVDYKTGKKSFKLKDIENGFNLQMLLYLAAIRAGGRHKFGDNIVPAGVLYSNVVLSAANAVLGKDDVNKAASGTEKPVSSGIFIDDEEILYAMDPTQNSMYLPIGRKNGEITKKDAVTSLEEMGALLDFACETAKQLAKEMLHGKKSITPFDGTASGVNIDPCAYCDMAPVCMGNIKSEQQTV